MCIKRILFLVPVVTFLLLALLPSAAGAKEVRPHDNCNNCVGNVYWSSISTEGAMSNTAVDNPSGTNFIHYSKVLIVFLNDTNHTIIEVGEAHNMSSCSLAGLYWAWEEISDSVGTVWHCVGAIDNRDDNYQVQLAISNESSGTNAGLNVWIYADHLRSTICYPCKVSAYDSGVSVYQSEYDINVADSGFTTHLVWGGTWVGNEYYAGGQWAYDTTTPSNQSPNPVQFYVDVPPNGSQNSGGTMYSCVYPSPASVCLIGS